MIAAQITKILWRLHALYPSSKARHNLTLGSDGTLRLTLFIEGKWYEFQVEDGDLDDPDVAVAQIIQAVKEARRGESK